VSLLDHPKVNRLSDNRLHLRHGPIDLIVEAYGSPIEVEAAYQQASESFIMVLTTLVSELKLLRERPNAHRQLFQGKIAIKMAEVANVFASDHFVTPMIAVAGAVADHVLHSMTLNRTLTKAYVNNGGDIAIYLNKTQNFIVGVCANPNNGAIVSKATIPEASDIRGIATSGWRGRSHSLGIADSVTVLARSAAIADAAATLIANAIDLPNHPMIKRAPATDLNPDSDLGDKLVTVDVGAICPADTRLALDSGQRLAQSMVDSKEIIGVYGNLNSMMFSLHPSLPAMKVVCRCETLTTSNVDSTNKEQAYA